MVNVPVNEVDAARIAAAIEHRATVAAAGELSPGQMRAIQLVHADCPNGWDQWDGWFRRPRQWG